MHPVDSFSLLFRGFSCPFDDYLANRVDWGLPILSKSPYAWLWLAHPLALRDWQNFRTNFALHFGRMSPTEMRGFVTFVHIVSCHLTIAALATAQYSIMLISHCSISFRETEFAASHHCA